MSVKNKKLPTGILGGTFDPPHRGHLALARAALAAGAVAQVLLIPARMPPHKSRPDITPPPLRLAMTALLVAEDERLRVSDIELQRAGASYTVETLRALLALHPTTRYRIIMGADMALFFGHWQAADEVAQLAPPLVADRPGSRMPENFADNGAENISPPTRKLLQAGRFTMAAEDISSTMIREAAHANAPLDKWLTKPVADFIQINRLYQMESL